MGARSWAECLRRLIEGYGGGSSDVDPPRDSGPKDDKAEATRELGQRRLSATRVPAVPKAEPEVARAMTERPQEQVVGLKPTEALGPSVLSAQPAEPPKVGDREKKMVKDGRSGAPMLAWHKWDGRKWVRET